MVRTSALALIAGLGIMGVSVAYAQAEPPAAPPKAGGVETAAPVVAPAGDDAANAKGRDLFNNWGCSSCHSLADAQATGHVGPSLDQNSNLTHDFVVSRVTNGQGPMPAFAGQMTPEEIEQVSSYIVRVSAK